MECILAICITLYGGLGVQSGYELTRDGETRSLGYLAIYEPTNDYGMFVGEINIEAQYGPVYAKAFHLSGINTPEYDMGMNSFSAGLVVKQGGFRVDIGLGAQYKADESIQSNGYGKTYAEASASYWLSNGMYIKATSVAGMQYLAVGMSSRWF